MPYVVKVFGAQGRINTQIRWLVGQVYQPGIDALSPAQSVELRENLTMELGHHEIESRIPTDLSTITLIGHLPRGANVRFG